MNYTHCPTLKQHFLQDALFFLHKCSLMQMFYNVAATFLVRNTRCLNTSGAMYFFPSSEILRLSSYTIANFIRQCPVSLRPSCTNSFASCFLSVKPHKHCFHSFSKSAYKGSQHKGADCSLSKSFFFFFNTGKLHQTAATRFNITTQRCYSNLHQFLN